MTDYSTNAYLSARYAIVASEHKRLNRALQQARLAEYHGHNVDHAYVKALSDRRDEAWHELGEIAASIRAVEGEAVTDETR